MSDRYDSSRRRVCQVLGSLLAAVPATSTAGAREPDTDSCNVEPYVAVVDRIVDGDHVVLLLEDETGLVDQLVVPVTAFDDVAERDILFVVIRDDALLAYRHLDDHPYR
ncbi:hypothetical protein [Halopiger goleimassiliensis]|uniref:hypothetical protein n=1 Tax=Halopiger goleimassiliensis TaxID=1293048 RepID=UPI00067810B9|nr:hypothetical protein [Halopiger goleimassiliensis]